MVAGEHEDFMRQRLAECSKAKRVRGVRVTPDDAAMIDHFEGMLRKYGAGVLEPSERRMLARLKKEAASAA